MRGSFLSLTSVSQVLERECGGPSGAWRYSILLQVLFLKWQHFVLKGGRSWFTPPPEESFWGGRQYPGKTDNAGSSLEEPAGENSLGSLLDEGTPGPPTLAQGKELGTREEEEG